MEIPADVLNGNWNIDPDKIPDDMPLEQSYGLFVLALRSNEIKKADRMFEKYMERYSDMVRKCFHSANRNMNRGNDRINKTIRMAICEYIAHQDVSNALHICKELGIKLNYSIFRYTISAKNRHLLEKFIMMDYPRQIKKQNGEVYHIINDILKIPNIPEDIFVRLVRNIIKAYPETKISWLTFLKLVRAGQFMAADHLLEFIDYNMWTGRELIQAIADSYNADSQTIEYLEKIHFYRKTSRIVQNYYANLKNENTEENNINSTITTINLI